MHRIDNSKSVAVRPTPEAVGPNPDSFFQGTDPGGGTPVDPDWLNAVQEELCTLIEAAGLTLSKTDNDQLLEAMLSMVAPTNMLYIQMDEYDGTTAALTVGGSDTHTFDLDLFTGEVGYPSYDDEEVLGIWVICRVGINPLATEDFGEVRYQYPGQITTTTIFQCGKSSETRADEIMMYLPINSGQTSFTLETVEADSGATEVEIIGVTQRGSAI